MERVLAGWFAEGTSYLSNLISSSKSGEEKVVAEGNKSSTTTIDEEEEVDAGRTERSRTDESGLSAASGSSRASTSSRSSHKIQKVMSWMVFGSKKVLYKKQQATHPHQQQHVLDSASEEAAKHHKKSALDVLLASGNENQHEIIDPADLDAVSVIGRGGYGKVMLMRSKEGKLVAVKEVAKTNLIDKPNSNKSPRPVSTKIEHAEMENLVLHSASESPFITSFHGSYQNKDKIFLLLEYCPGGELFQHMQRQGVFTESRTRLYVAEIVAALTYLHDRGVVYRDLKPENILLDARGHIRITDFGLSIQFNKQGDDNLMRCYSICGTPEYIAPEIILMATTKKNDRNATYGKTVDWWALGILMYEMLYRIPPFYHKERKTMLNKILSCQLQFPKSAKVKPVSREAMDFITALLQYDEKDRLGYGNQGSLNVRNHPFLAPLDFDKVAALEVEPEFVPVLDDDVDTQNFDASFTKEFLRQDASTPCPFNLELTGYHFLPEDFAEAQWFPTNL